MRITKTKRRKRARKHGYQARKETAGGRATLKRRRNKGRKTLSVKVRKA